jgi:hypothetical protein
MNTLSLIAGILLATAASAQDSQWTTLDSDSNGSLSKTEASNDPEMAAIFEAADSNQDGQLTREEYTANQTAQPKPTDTSTPPSNGGEHSEH